MRGNTGFPFAITKYSRGISVSIFDRVLFENYGIKLNISTNLFGTFIVLLYYNISACRLNSLKIEELTASLRRLRFTVLWRNPSFLRNNFEWLEDISDTLKNPEMAAGLIFTGKQACENENWEKLSQVVNDLLDLVPQEEQEKHTGIVGIL